MIKKIREKMNSLNSLLFVISCLIGCKSIAQADSQTSAASSSALKSYHLARELNWAEARAEADIAIKNNPKDAHAWFMKGVSEERLENLDDAVKAFEQYLLLAPNSAASKEVQAKLPEFKRRRDIKNQDIYGSASSGFFVEKILSYKPDYVSEVNGTLSTPIGFGFKFGSVMVGFRQSKGTFKEDVRVPDDSEPPVYSTVSGGGTLSTTELFFNIHMSLVDPYTTWGDLQLTLPITLGMLLNSLDVSANSTSYVNLEYDLGIGLAVRGYTRSPLMWYAQGIYHLGIPFWALKENGTDTPIRNAKNEDIKGSISGFEVTVGIAFLFGSETKKHY